jgi:hypothetical protein
MEMTSTELDNLTDKSSLATLQTHTAKRHGRQVGFFLLRFFFGVNPFVEC